MTELMNKPNEDNTMEEKSEMIIPMTLKKPITIDGEKINKLTLDFTGLTGADILSIDNELRLEGHAAGFDNIFNQAVLLKLTSRVTGILPDDLNKMFGPEFLEVMLQVRNFFIRW